MDGSIHASNYHLQISNASPSKAAGSDPYFISKSRFLKSKKKQKRTNIIIIIYYLTYSL